MNARPASSGVPGNGWDAKSYITSGEPPKSFHRAVIFGALAADLRLFNVWVWTLVACLTFCKPRAVLRSKSGAGLAYILVNGVFSVPDAAVEPVNGFQSAAMPTPEMIAIRANLKIEFLFIRFALIFIFPPKVSFLINF